MIAALANVLQATSSLGLQLCMWLGAAVVLAPAVGFLCGAAAHFFLAGWGFWQ